MSYTKAEKIDNTGKFCDYGCGNVAYYYFHRPRKFCCSQHVFQCPQKSKENKVKTLERAILRKQYTVKNLTYYEHLYPLSYQMEELRENPIDRIVQGRCTYSECPNSAKNDGWFNVPSQFFHFREWALIREMDGYRFYCSKECRKQCPAHGMTGVRMIKEYGLMTHDDEWNNSRASEEDRKLFRIVCLERDSYTCQLCGADADHVHHIQPVKTNPMLELDPDNGISVCEYCHYHKCHANDKECTTGALANKKCYEIRVTL